MGEAELRGNKVFFDVVMNHTADVIAYQECHDDGNLPEGGSCPFRSWDQEAYTPFIPAGKEELKFPLWLQWLIRC